MGFNGDSINSFTFNAFEEEGQNGDYYIEWYKEINVFEDICDLEINAITDNIKADFDQIIPTADGIIYFLNPLKEEEKQFFEIILPIINSVKRDIPIVLIYNSDYSFLPISTNKLLENLWFNHFDLEAFVNLKPNELYQALQCLCFAMITGDSPLNIENAWMRFPIFIQLGNIFYKKAVNEHKPELYYYAAQNVRKAAMIADILNKEDYYIISDQAALLFSKTNLYLEASKILADIDKKKAKNFKKLYADSMILEGNKLFNNKKYELAAEQYLAAAQWLAIEMNSPELGEEAFRLSINSWISACRVEMAFKVLSSLPHEKAIDILNEIVEKVISEVDFLVKNKNLDAARDQLYRTIAVYQKEGLFTLLERFTYKLEEILIKILQSQIDDKERFAARQTFEEIENLWESYGVKKTKLDKALDKLVRQFLEDYDFPSSAILINKIESLSLKKDLTKLSSNYEEDFKRIRKGELEENLNRGLEELTLFIDEELRIIDTITKDVILKADKLIEQDNYLNAAEIIESHADFLNKIGREEIQNQIMVKLLDILLIGKQFKKFLTTFEKLPDFLKKEFLNIKFKIIIEKIKEYSNEKVFSEISTLFETLIIFYREQMLYEKSKDLSKLFIDYIKKEAITILRTQETVHAVNEALKLVKKANTISLAYLEGEKQNFDQIYQFIIEIYIKEELFSDAYSINEKIDDKVLKKEIDRKIGKKVEEKQEKEKKIKQKSEKKYELKSIKIDVELKAKKANQNRQIDFNKRKGFKRYYFDKGLDYLRKNDYSKAFEEYKNSIEGLIKRPEYNLAGISLAIIYLILIKQNDSSKINEILSTTKEKLGNLENLFTDTFSVELIEYIRDLEEFGEDIESKEAILLLENLPLFEEEQELLHSILGKEIKHIHEAITEKAPIAEIIGSEEESKQQLSREEIAQKRALEIRMEQIYGNLSKQLPDRLREKLDLLKKRKVMKRRIYKEILAELKQENYKKASELYFEQAMTMARRKDLNTGALMVLLHGLSLIKAHESFEKIQIDTNEFLDSLGSNRRLIKDTYYITCILFIFDVISNNLEVFQPKIQPLLEALPLLEEELVLLDIF